MKVLINKMKISKQNKLIIVGFIIVIILCWRLVFSKTFDLYQEYKDLKSKNEQLNLEPQQIAKLKNEINQYEKVLGSIENDREGLLKIVGEKCEKHKVRIIDFPAPVEQHIGDYKVQFHLCELTGSYSNLLHFLDEFERPKKIANIASVEFKTIKNYQTSKNELHEFIYFQTVLSVK
jgi:Tfp pilus assembly protein PilO